MFLISTINTLIFYLLLHTKQTFTIINLLSQICISQHYLTVINMYKTSTHYAGLKNVEQK